MEEERNQPAEEKREIAETASAGKQPWKEPTLAFVEPKLTKHGNLEKVTHGRNGFFGQFSP